jgi:hypothetical protein
MRAFRVPPRCYSLWARRGTTSFATRIWTGSRRWFSVVVRSLTSPCSVRDFDGRTSSTSLSRLSSSPGRTGRGQAISPPAPTTPPASFRSPSTRSRMVKAGVPAARRQSAEERVVRGLFVEVEGLRIEFGREHLDLIGVNAEPPRAKGLADRKVFGIALRHPRLHFALLRLRCEWPSRAVRNALDGRRAFYWPAARSLRNRTPDLTATATIAPSAVSAMPRRSHAKSRHPPQHSCPPRPVVETGMNTVAEAPPARQARPQDEVDGLTAPALEVTFAIR